MTEVKEYLVIIGDCGGTNTRLSLWSIDVNLPWPKRGEMAPGTLLYKKSFLNEKFIEFTDIIKAFLLESKVSMIPTVACFACAGPIQDNSVNFTNLKHGWFINGKDLEKTLSIEKVYLLNDFTAMGYGVLTLAENECLKLNECSPVTGGVVAVIGAGTGLGECYLTYNTELEEYTCFPSEGGHCDWNPHNELETELLNYARKKYNHRNRISVERIISGNGISLIYEFLSRVKYPELLDPIIDQQWQSEGANKSAIIATNAKKCSLCNIAMEVFFNAYASEAGNAMLKWLPFGGFFITGGISNKNMEYFTKDEKFLKTATDKGRVSDVIKKCPMYVANVVDVGERGTHYFAFQMLKKNKLN